MKLFIVGLPGSGKSTLGVRLALRLKLPFLDLDQCIEQEAQQPIRDLFAQQGEAAFRQLEQRALREAMQHQEMVLATGGGAPCFYDNMQVMNHNGTTIYLEVPIPVIVARMQGDQITDRPLLHGMNRDHLAQEYTAKFEERLPVYRQAHIIVNQHTTTEEVVALLKARS